MTKQVSHYIYTCINYRHAIILIFIYFILYHNRAVPGRGQVLKIARKKVNASYLLNGKHVLKGLI